MKWCRSQLLARAYLAGAASLCAADLVLAQCEPVWLPDFDSIGFDSASYSACAFDEDGLGPQPPRLFVGGQFRQAGAEPMIALARWDPTVRRWTQVGGGLALDATIEGPPGGFASVDAMVVFDDDAEGPHSPALFVGGVFASAGGEPGSKCIARWDGQSWSPLDSGITVWGVRAFAVFDDDGNGPRLPALYAAGWFERAGGMVCNSIARWDGETWEPLANGVLYPYSNDFEGVIHAVAVFDEDGLGPRLPALFAGGFFSVPGAGGIEFLARWDGTEWTIVGESPPDREVESLAVFDEDGDGPSQPALFVGGSFEYIGGLNIEFLARWDGAQWSPMDDVLLGGSVNLHVLPSDPTLAGPRSSMIATGAFYLPDLSAFLGFLVRFDGSAWTPLGTLDPHLCGGPFAIVDFDEDGPGPASRRLYMPASVRGLYSGQPGRCENQIRPMQDFAVWGVPHLSGDSDDSGAVDFGDVISTIQTWGADYRPTTGPGDANRDGLVNFDDVLSALANFGAACAPLR